MGKREHILAGTIVGLILIFLGFVFFRWFLLGWKELLSLLLIITMYPLLPDIDHRSATITWLFIWVSIIGLIASKVFASDPIFYISVGLLVVTCFCVEFFPHRGFTHSITFGLIVSVPLVFFLPWYFVILAFVCYYVHLVCDKLYLKWY